MSAVSRLGNPVGEPSLQRHGAEEKTHRRHAEVPTCIHGVDSMQEVAAAREARLHDV